MNKRSIRAFSFGILFSLVFIWSSSLFFQDENQLTSTKAKALLKEEGYVILSKEDYNQLLAQKPKEAPKEETEEKQGDENSSSNNSEKTVSYKLEIISGMNTEEISVILEKEKIINDAESFEQYLAEHDYSTRVQIGTFELNSKMDFEEISRIITKS